TSLLILFFFNDTAPTEIYTLSLHDALPICTRTSPSTCCPSTLGCRTCPTTDRKSTRLNSSHPSISYAVFCLKKNKNIDCDARKSPLVHLTQTTCVTTGAH